MKIRTTILFSLAGAFSALVLGADSTNQPAAPASPPPAAPPAPLVEQTIEGTVPPPGRVPNLQPPPPIPEDNARIGGLIGEAAQMKQPLQLFNPLAPPEYGNGLQNLSLNPETGRAEGVTLLSFPFKSKSPASKAPKPPKPPKAAKSKAKAKS